MALKIKKGDKVIVISGKNKGATGEVLKIYPEKNRAMVRGINIVKKHTKPTQNDPGGIKEKEGTINISNIAFLEEGKNKGSGVDSYDRYIYIHGTHEEGLIGQKASHGCIRMFNQDVIYLYDKVEEGTKVLIRT